MTRLMGFTKDNWYLFLLLAVVVGTAVFFRLHPDADGDGDDSKKIAQAAVAGDARTWTPERPSEAQRARQVITEHRKKFEAAPKDPMAPALLASMGNLYRQKLNDTESAVQCYERLLHDYPNWEAKRSVYIQLMSCYKEQNDRESLRRIYRDMKEAFPPDSQEYKYAEQELSH